MQDWAKNGLELKLAVWYLLFETLNLTLTMALIT